MSIVFEIGLEMGKICILGSGSCSMLRVLAGSCTACTSSRLVCTECRLCILLLGLKECPSCTFARMLYTGTN